MRFLVDPHTHTISSGHARSTVRENALAAKQAGMEGICCTDHGPAMEGAAVEFLVTVLSGGPEFIEGRCMLIARTFKSSLLQRWSAHLWQNGMTKI